jgi:hypothetical protein
VTRPHIRERRQEMTRRSRYEHGTRSARVLSATGPTVSMVERRLRTDSRPPGSRTGPASTGASCAPTTPRSAPVPGTIRSLGEVPRARSLSTA